MIAHAYIPISGDGAIRQQLARSARERWGGLTVSAALGQWRSPSGRLITERIDTWEVACCGRKRDIKAWWKEFANTAKRLLKQEQVMVALFDGDTVVSE